METGKPTRLFRELPAFEQGEAERRLDAETMPDITCSLVALASREDLDLDFGDDEREMLERHAESCDACQLRSTGASGDN